MTYKVEKGVPIPHARYPLDEMDVGDSFFIACEGREGVRSKQTSVLISGKRKGLNLTTRQVPGGVRVWLLRKSADKG